MFDKQTKTRHIQTNIICRGLCGHRGQGILNRDLYSLDNDYVGYVDIMF
jgi:hypothetical protein